MQAIYRLANYNSVDENSELFLRFLDDYRNNKLEELMLSCGLNQLEEVLHQDMPVDAKPDRYLTSLLKLFYFEEMTVKLEYCKYDIHYSSVHFTPYVPHKSYSNIVSQISPDSFQYHLATCKMKIRGSSELRPRILIGNIIKLRPSQADQLKYGLNLFELVGTVLNYTLASEEAVVIFTLPKILPVASQTIYLNHKDQEESNHLAIWNKIKYHARFTDDRSHFGFIHYLIQHILLPTPNVPTTGTGIYLLNCLFPTQPIISLLKEFRLQYHRSNDQSHRANLNFNSSESISNKKFNQQQEKAIEEVVIWTGINRRSEGGKLLSMPPFIIFGPAGTGKRQSISIYISIFIPSF
jgi:hypothetical protein